MDLLIIKLLFIKKPSQTVNSPSNRPALVQTSAVASMLWNYKHSASTQTQQPQNHFNFKISLVINVSRFIFRANFLNQSNIFRAVVTTNYVRPTDECIFFSTTTTIQFSVPVCLLKYPCRFRLHFHISAKVPFDANCVSN